MAKTCGECRWIFEYTQTWWDKLLRAPVRHGCGAHYANMPNPSVPGGLSLIYESVHPTNRQCNEDFETDEGVK